MAWGTTSRTDDTVTGLSFACVLCRAANERSAVDVNSLKQYMEVSGVRSRLLVALVHVARKAHSLSDVWYSRRKFRTT